MRRIFLFLLALSSVAHTQAQGIKLERPSHPLNPADSKNSAASYTEDALIPTSGVAALEKQEKWLRDELKKFPPLKSQIFPPQAHFGYMSKRRTVSSESQPMNEWVEVMINETTPVRVESIALVPAYFPDYSGEGNYGFPKRFKIDVFTHQDPSTAVTIVDWTEQDFPDPGLYPVLFKFPDIQIQRLRLTVSRGVRENNTEFYALNEIMIFRGGTNIAPPIAHFFKVSSSAVATPFWHQAYLSDRKIHLGKPLHTSKKIPDFIQYFDPRSLKDKPPEIMIDLGSVQSIGRLEVYSAKVQDLPVPAIALPEKYRIELYKNLNKKRNSGYGISPINQLPDERWHTLSSQDARYLRVIFDKLPTHQGRPVLALGEMRVISDRNLFQGNLAKGKKVTLKNFPKDHQSDPQTLVNGYTNGKKIIPYKLYIEQLAKRQLVENALLDVSERLVIARAVRTQRYWTIGIALAVTAIFSYILTLIYQKNKRRKMLLDVQQQIAADLHDDISGNLGTISMISNRLQSSSDQNLIQDKLREIKHLAQESFISVKEIIWHTETETLHFSDLFQQIQRTARSILSDCSITYQFPDGYDDLVVPIKTRRNVILLVKESLYNCAKYADASEVTISADIHDSLLELSMVDDGRGFDTSCDKNAETQSGRGLENMKRRATLLGADFSITSSPGMGTSVTLRMPIKPN